MDDYIEKEAHTCRDCFHWDACKKMLEAAGYVVSESYEPDARRCDTFTPAADVYTEEDVRAAYTDGYSTGMVQGMEKATVPELRKTVELLHNEYEKAKRQEFVYDPLAYAVYQVWKAVDGRRKNGR